TAGARRALGAGLVDAPITPLAFERAVALDVVIDYATALAILAGGVRNCDDVSVLNSDTVILRAGIPAKLIDIAVGDYFQRAFVVATGRIAAGDVVLARDVRRRCIRLRS